MSRNRVVFLGPPGAGKGTHAAWIAEEKGLAHLSTGDMLRAAVREGSKIGNLARGLMEEGKLVPDEVMIDLIFERMSGGGAMGWILDGFPRTVPQAGALDSRLEKEGLSLHGVILFEVPESTLVERLSSRLSCPSCGSVFNKVSHPPEREGYCDQCRTELRTREDDQPRAVRQRLEVYQDSTAPLVGYYRERGLLLSVDANRSIDAIRADLSSLFG